VNLEGIIVLIICVILILILLKVLLHVFMIAPFSIQHEVLNLQTALQALRPA
jgi:hypothetical protein